jgi:tetratricopeptide (TPR) repeat protein
MKHSFGLISVLLLLVSCNPGKKFMKQGNEQFEIGNVDGAANLYYNVLLVQPNNLEAQQALYKSGNQVLQGKFMMFSKYVVANEADLSVKQYLYCKKYFDRCKAVGVMLDWPSMYDPIYEDIKNEYISKKYDEGVKYIRSNKYAEAEKMFADIALIDSSYNKATALRLKSIIEPLFQHGIKMKNEANYKEAYRDFNKVLDLDPTYKNAADLRQEVILKASLDIGVMPVQNQTKIQGFDVRLYQLLVSSLQQNKSPFLKVVDRGAIESALREQAFGLKDIIDAESAAKVGKLIGLEYVLLTAMTELVYDDDGIMLDSIIAYNAITESTPSKNPTDIPQSITRFKKVSYLDVHQKRKLVMAMAYQLVSAQTGQIVSSESIKEELFDEFHSCSYAGNLNTLYPELPAGNTMPSKPVEFREQFNQVKRDIRSKEDLTRELCKRISDKVIDDLNIYIDK